MEKILENEQKTWKIIFQLANANIDFNKPLTTDILSKPDHSFVKTIVYIYTMESFVY